MALSFLFREIVDYDWIESLWVHSPRLAACAVIPADAGIQKPDWMPDQVRHDAEYPAACGGVVYFWFCPPASALAIFSRFFPFHYLFCDIDYSGDFLPVSEDRHELPF